MQYSEISKIQHLAGATNAGPNTVDSTEFDGELWLLCAVGKKVIIYCSNNYGSAESDSYYLKQTIDDGLHKNAITSVCWNNSLYISPNYLNVFAVASYGTVIIYARSSDPSSISEYYVYYR